MEDLHPRDVELSAAACREVLVPAAGADWGEPAGDLEWSCRRTLDHIVDALAYYCAHLATRSTERLPFARDGAPMASVEDLLVAVGSQAAVLARVVEASPKDARAYHSAGMADPSGFVAMGCDEVLVHTNDICAGLGLAFGPPADLCARVVARLFPWGPEGVDPWQAMLWCNGRRALPGLERLGPDWWWWCRPLEEWDGVAHTRTEPPAWT